MIQDQTATAHEQQMLSLWLYISQHYPEVVKTWKPWAGHLASPWTPVVSKEQLRRALRVFRGYAGTECWAVTQLTAVADCVRIGGKDAFESRKIVTQGLSEPFVDAKQMDNLVNDTIDHLLQTLSGNRPVNVSNDRGPWVIVNCYALIENEPCRANGFDKVEEFHG